MTTLKGIPGCPVSGHVLECLGCGLGAHGGFNPGFLGGPLGLLAAAWRRASYFAIAIAGRRVGEQSHQTSQLKLCHATQGVHPRKKATRSEQFQANAPPGNLSSELRRQQRLAACGGTETDCVPCSRHQASSAPDKWSVKEAA
jgi:hypothetical protein